MKKILSIVFIIVALISGCQQETDPSQWRGVWVTNVDSKVLDSKESIEEAMAFLAEKGFNVVMPVVWNDAYTIYPSKVMKTMFDREISPRFEGRDPLKELTDAAHRNGLQVIAWFEYGFAASYNKNGGFLLKKKPHWAARDAEGKLLTKNGFEWMNAYHPEVQDFLLSLVKEVVQQYDVDGVQGDDRLPAQPSHGGYSEYTVKLYRSEHRNEAPPKNHRDMAWMKWRAEKLNDFAKKLYDEVKAMRQDILVTWAPSVYPWCYDEYLQDWPSWIREGYADVVIPQAYRYNLTDYKNTVRNMSKELAGITNQDIVYLPGVLLNVGDYLMPEKFLKETVEFNRNSGFQGEILFFYEGLRKENDRNALILQELYKDDE